MFVPSPCQMTINRRNSCASRIITGSVSGSRKRVPTRLRIATWDIGEDKSFADDLNKKQSIVSSRVALLLRSAEIKLLFHRFVQIWTFLPPHKEVPEGLLIDSCSWVFILCVSGSWGFVPLETWWWWGFPEGLSLKMTWESYRGWWHCPWFLTTGRHPCPEPVPMGSPDPPTNNNLEKIKPQALRFNSLWGCSTDLTKNYSTQYSRVVPHHSTDCAITSLTSEIRRDPVLSGVYGRS